MLCYLHGHTIFPPPIISIVVVLDSTIPVWNPVNPSRSNVPGNKKKDVNPHKAYMK